MSQETARIGFISTRLAGTDGVSLETAKWVSVLEAEGHTCHFFAGECDWPTELSHVVNEAHFEHPRIREINTDLFDNYLRQPRTSQSIQALKGALKEALYDFLETFELDLLIVENALAIPMNVPLGLALTEVIAETGRPTIAHHHDFYWERQRFSSSAAQDYLRAAFPPTLPSLYHVVINSFGQRQLAHRCGGSSTFIPNVMDFENPPDLDGYADDLREALEIPEDAAFLLQPTRVVPRKRIEQTIELVRRLELPATLVISHAAGDEGRAYARYLEEYARFLDVDMRFASDRIAHHRGKTPNGEKVYSLGDAYQRADLVAYPSAIEGFGNAFLETLYYRRPIILNRYPVFQTDIQPKGFDVIAYKTHINSATVQNVRELLHSPARIEEMVEHNYTLGTRHYAFDTLRRALLPLIDKALLA